MKTSDEIFYSFVMVVGIVGSLAGIAWLMALLWTGTLFPPYPKGDPTASSSWWPSASAAGSHSSEAGHE